MPKDDQRVRAIWGRLLTGENKRFEYIDNNTPELSMAVTQKYRNHEIGTDSVQAIASEYQKIGVE